MTERRSQVASRADVAPAAALYVRESELRRFQTQASELTVEWSLPVSKRPDGRLPLYVIAPAAAAEPSELAEMEARKDAAYLERNQVVAALAKCFPSGVARTAIEGWSEDWHGCVFIDLPTGQASWHFHDSQAYLFEGLPPYTGEWDGHDTPEKYRRLAALASPPPQATGAPAEFIANWAPPKGHPARPKFDREFAALSSAKREAEPLTEQQIHDRITELRDLLP